MPSKALPRWATMQCFRKQHLVYMEPLLSLVVAMSRNDGMRSLGNNFDRVGRE